MNRIVLLVFLLALLSGCRITTTVVGEGTIISRSGSFACTTGNSGDCVEDYQAAGSETFEAVPAPGWTFVKWTNCSYATLTTCNTHFGTNTTNHVWPITATFRPISLPVQPATYTYNALGQRMTKTLGNVTTLFQYDLDGNLIAELDSSGLALRQHVHLNGEPIAQLSRNATGGVDAHYVHPDHIGTPMLLTNQSGKVVADIEATPFGETYIDYAEIEYNRRFPGQYKDAETGLHYNYFRDYDPTVGRYVQSDPIGLGGGLNTYVYVMGNPLSHHDPYGLASLYTDMSGGTTTFDPRPEDPRGNPVTFPSRNGVDRRSKPGAADPYKTADVRVVRLPAGKSYGDGTFIDTGEKRGRGIHGGGSCPGNEYNDPQAPQQGWCVTLGCTRMQNEDIQELAELIKDFKDRHPGAAITYTRK